MKYTISFEVYGKYLKTEVEAKNIEEAKQKVKDRIVFHKIEQQESNSFINFFNDILDGKIK